MKRSDRLAALVALLLLFALPSASRGEGIRLRYGFEPGQTWRALQTVARETRVADTTTTRTGSARFRYDVKEGSVPGAFRLEGRMISQQTEAGLSPFDFSVIQFKAEIDARGVTRGVRFEIDDADPPDIPGIEKDATAYRQVLRSLAEAWIDAVYWLPMLPERPLEIGESFVLGDRGNVGGTDPGVRMEIEEKSTYRLRAVEDGVAHFDIEVRSRIEAAAADSGVRSSLAATGEATFDLARGMWRRRELRSEQRANLRGAGDAERASAKTVTTIEVLPGS